MSVTCCSACLRASVTHWPAPVELSVRETQLIPMSATMRATLAKAFGEPNSVLNVAPSHPRPVLNPKSKDLLIHVKACSLSPGDYRRLRGEADGAFPAIQFPYIPGGDVCGVVEAVGDDVQGFKVGDEVRQSPPASSRPCPPSNNHHTHTFRNHLEALSCACACRSCSSSLPCMPCSVACSTAVQADHYNHRHPERPRLEVISTTSAPLH